MRLWRSESRDSRVANVPSPGGTFRQRVDAGETVRGVLSDIGDPLLIELCAYTGFDFVCLDLEHGSMTDGDVANAVRAGDAAGLPVLIRVRPDELARATRFLDLGGVGVIIAHVRSRDEAARGLHALLVPPTGHRGVGGTRSARFGLVPTDALWASRQNERLFVGMQVEDREGIANAREIGDLSGVALVFVGARDLSFDLGVPGSYADPAVSGSIQRVLEACEGQAAVGIVIRDAHVPPPPGPRFLMIGLAAIFRLATEASALKPDAG